MATYYVQFDRDLFQVPQVDGLAEWFDDLLCRPDSATRFLRVAELGGQIVGYIGARIEAPVDNGSRQMLADLSRQRLFINVLAVQQEHWRHGIGRRLLEAAEAWGREQGAAVALLDAYLQSPVSMPFYEEGMHYQRQEVRFRKLLR